MPHRFILPVIAAALAAAVASSACAADVGVSINFAQPGVYGRVDIGRFPAPALIAPQPVLSPMPVVIGAPRPVLAAPAEPMYLWVPPGHRARWDRYCGRYHACGRPVYFVRDDWYHDKVMVHRMPPGQARKVEHEEHEEHDAHDRDDGRHHGNPHRD